MRVGLGCMRLSTDPEPDEPRALTTIAAAVDAAITVFDTARAYGPAGGDGWAGGAGSTAVVGDHIEGPGHNERLLARALGVAGAGPEVRVVTKGGMARPGGAWVPDGRARTIRADCEASLVALDGRPIALWLLHAPDPRTPWATTLRAVGRLLDEGLVEAVGLSNVTRAQLDQALDLVPVAAVEQAVSVLDDTVARGGVLARCEEQGIVVLAHSPLGGPGRVGRLRRDPVLGEVAATHDATPAEVALAWLMARSPVLVPIPGARRPETARSVARAADLVLGPGELAAIARRHGWPEDPGSGPDRRSGTGPMSSPRPGSGGLQPGRPESGSPEPGGAEPGDVEPPDGEVVIVMGVPGAGKTRAAAELAAAGYHRLNRDERGGSLRQLAADLDAALVAGHRRVVLDNTYLTRAERSRVVETALAHGLAVRCRWLDTPLAQAQVNLVLRLLDRFGGTLPTPEELAAAARREPGMLTPTAQMRAVRQLEAPMIDEGFTSLERLPFERTDHRAADEPEAGPDAGPGPGGGRPYRPGLLVAAGALTAEGWEATVAEAAADRPGCPTLLFDWRPDGQPSELAGLAAELAQITGGPVDVALCPHPGGPPRCWCRPPLPGMPLAFARAGAVDLSRTTLIGSSQAHRTLATTLGVRYQGISVAKQSPQNPTN